MDYKEINTEEHIKKVAKSNGVSIEECKYEMEKAINIASENPTELFIKIFGNRTPNLDEFICKLACMVYEEQEKVNNYGA